jgi:hypothetical protein
LLLLADLIELAELFNLFLIASMLYYQGGKMKEKEKEKGWTAEGG